MKSFLETVKKSFGLVNRDWRLIVVAVMVGFFPKISSRFVSGWWVSLFLMLLSLAWFGVKLEWLVAIRKGHEIKLGQLMVRGWVWLRRFFLPAVISSLVLTVGFLVYLLWFWKWFLIQGMGRINELSWNQELLRVVRLFTNPITRNAFLTEELWAGRLLVVAGVAKHFGFILVSLWIIERILTNSGWIKSIDKSWELLRKRWWLLFWYLMIRVIVSLVVGSVGVLVGMLSGSIAFVGLKLEYFGGFKGVWLVFYLLVLVYMKLFVDGFLVEIYVDWREGRKKGRRRGRLSGWFTRGRVR